MFALAFTLAYHSEAVLCSVGLRMRDIAYGLTVMGCTIQHVLFSVSPVIIVSRVLQE
jgi:hypothetical protein